MLQKYWRSLKVILPKKYLFTMKGANVKTLNLQKQIFCPECESTSFVKINLHKILRKSNFILLSIIFIQSIVVIISSSKTNHSRS